jgi:hypothetical protein
LQIPDPNDLATLNARIPISPGIPIGPGAPLSSAAPQGTGLVSDVLLDICNASTATTHVVDGASVQITTFTPFVGSANAWHVCDDFFTRSVPSGVTGQCGATSVFDEDLRVTFPSTAGAGFTQTAVFVTATVTGLGPLPVSLAPGHAVRLHLAIRPPAAHGTYTFAFSVTADHTPMPFLSVGSSTLFAPVAHKFTGAACSRAAMQQQIPMQITPALFFICPEGVTALPKAAPGRR